MRIAILALFTAAALVAQYPKPGGGSGSSSTGGGGGGVSTCSPASASSTAYTCTASPAITALAAGVTVALVPDVVSGASPTLNAGGGAKSIVLTDGATAISSGFLRTGMTYMLVYDGTRWRTVNNCWPSPLTGSIAFNNAALTGTSAVSISILPTIAGDAVIASATIQVSTRFTSSDGTLVSLTWEMGRNGGGTTDEWIPAFESLAAAAAGAPQWFWEDRPARALIGSGNTYDMYVTARQTSGKNLNTLTAGSLKWSIGPACYSGATQ